MKKIINILILLPFFGMAQFNVELIAINLEDDDEISSVQVNVGDVYGWTYDGAARLDNVDLDHLNDTLFIDHVNFRFDQLPLTQHDFFIEDNTMYVTVYGNPWKQSRIDFNLNIAKSKKVKNDTVDIHWNYNGPNMRISFQENQHDGTYTSLGISPLRKAYDDLTDGYFYLKTDLLSKKVAFQKEDWMQLVCLDQPSIPTTSEREFDLIKHHFETIETAKAEKEQLSRTHRIEVEQLEEKIEELNTEIDRLKGVPVPEPDIFPIDFEERLDDPVIHFVNSKAKPTIGYDSFLAGLKIELENAKTKYSGNVTLEIMVQRNGRAKVRILHASQDKQEIAEKIKFYIQRQEWEPAMNLGRITENSTILSIEIDQKD